MSQFKEYKLSDLLSVGGCDDEIEQYQKANPSKATDEYIGVVSFIPECQSDAATLIVHLTKKHKNSFKLHTSESDFEFGVEMELSRNLTIKKLHNEMVSLVDMHWCFETLRALPLDKNPQQREDTSDVYDWCGTNEAQLLGFGEK